MELAHLVVSVFCVCTLFSCSSAQTNQAIASNGVYTEVLGNSGKITIGKTDPPSDDPNGVTITFSGIEETDSAGRKLKGNQGEKHSFNNFASQSFQFSDTVHHEYQQVDCVSFNFSATLEDVNAMLNVQVITFKASGNITVDNEWTLVKSGLVKFNIDITDWTFCDAAKGNCQGDAVGAYLTFEMDMKSKSKAQNYSDNDDSSGDAYEIGDDVYVILSRKVNVDGNVHIMGNGYPMVIQKDQKQVYIFQFPRGNVIAYDPSVDLTGSSSGSVSTVLAASLLTVITSLMLSRMSV